MPVVDHKGGDGRFRLTLEFVGLEGLMDFGRFVAIIRGDATLDEQKLLELTARLRESTNAEQAAVDAAKKGK